MVFRADDIGGVVVERGLSKLAMCGTVCVALWLAGCNSAGSPYANGGSSLSGSSMQVEGASAQAADKCLAAPSFDSRAQQVLSLINIERARVGVAPLTLNPKLAAAAEDFACTMAAEDFFEHLHPLTGEGPGDRAKAAGYSFFAVGENLAAGQTTAAEAVEGWMESPDHRDNLLSPEWTETGIGIRGGGTYGIYWVQEFGRPASIGHQAVFVDGNLTVVR